MISIVLVVDDFEYTILNFFLNLYDLFYSKTTKLIKDHHTRKVHGINNIIIC